MRRLLLYALALVVLVASPLLAEEIKPGQRYNGPTVLSVGQLGLSFTLPRDWIGALQGDYFLVGSQTVGGLIILSSDKMTIDQAKAWLSQPQALGDGYVLYPKGDPQVTQQTVRVNCALSDGATQLEGRVHVRIGPHGIGLAVVTVAPSRPLGPIAQAADAIEQSVQFSQPVAPKASVTGAWGSQLAGVKIIRFYTGSGYQEKEYYNFCPDGSFYRVFESGGATPNVASGAFLDQNGGAWSASGSLDGGQVHLQYRNGNTAVLQVAIQNNKLMVNGKRWLRDTGNCH